MTDSAQTVFIVDDDEDVRDSLVELFKSIGINAKCYESATKFIEDYQEDLSGCMLTDVRMPGMSGIELQEHLNKKKISDTRAN